MNTTNIEIKQEGKELIILSGAAAPYREPRIIKIEGTIASLIDFAQKRKDLLTAQNSHIVIEVGKGMDLTATFVADEDSHFAKTVVGKLVANQEIQDLGINTDKTYTTNQLRNLLKLKRHLFKSRDSQAAIMKALEDFSAKTSITFKTSNDYAGNVVFNKITECTSNLVLEFDLKAPIFIGYDDKEFAVKVEVQPVDGELRMNLISYDLVDRVKEVIEGEKASLRTTFAAIPLIFK